MIYKAMLENDINDGIIQDPDDPGVDLDAVEKAIAGDNGIGAHQDEVDDAVEGMIGDPVEEFAMIMYESEYNYNQIMEAIGMAELREAAMGRDLVLNEADTNGFFAKIKEFFVNMFERLTETVRNVIAKLINREKSDKIFAVENQDLIEKGFKTDCWKDEEGYSGVFVDFDLNEIMKQEIISIEDVNSLKKAKDKLSNLMNNADIDETLNELQEANKKDLTIAILKKSFDEYKKEMHDLVFGDKVKLDTVIKNPSDIIDGLKEDSSRDIRKSYNDAKISYKIIFNNISKWENAAKKGNIDGKEKYLAACQIMTKAYKIERSACDAIFSICISACNYKKSVCRKIAHMCVAEAKKNNDAAETNNTVSESGSLFGRINLA